MQGAPARAGEPDPFTDLAAGGGADRAGRAVDQLTLWGSPVRRAEPASLDRDELVWAEPLAEAAWDAGFAAAPADGAQGEAEEQEYGPFAGPPPARARRADFDGAIAELGIDLNSPVPSPRPEARTARDISRLMRDVDISTLSVATGRDSPPSDAPCCDEIVASVSALDLDDASLVEAKASLVDAALPPRQGGSPERGVAVPQRAGSPDPARGREGRDSAAAVDELVAAASPRSHHAPHSPRSASSPGSPRSPSSPRLPSKPRSPSSPRPPVPQTSASPSPGRVVAAALPRYVNLYWRRAGQVVALRLALEASPERARSALLSAARAEEIPAFTARALLAELDRFLVGNALHDAALWARGVDRSAEWEAYVRAEAGAAELEARARAAAGLPIWFTPSPSTAVAERQQQPPLTPRDIVYRQAMRAALSSPRVLEQILAHECTCTQQVRAATVERASARRKLREVQLAEMQFMCESLVGGNGGVTVGVTHDDLSKLGLAHVEATERLGRQHVEEMARMQARHIKEHRAATLSLVGSAAVAASRAVEAPAPAAPTAKPAATPTASPPPPPPPQPMEWGALDPATRSGALRDGLVALAGSGSAGPSPATGPLAASPSDDSLLLGAVSNLVARSLAPAAAAAPALGSDAKAQSAMSTAASAATRRRLSRLSTAVDAFDVYLGAQFKVLFSLRIEVAVGGVMLAVTDRAQPKPPPMPAYVDWRRAMLDNVYGCARSEPQGPSSAGERAAKSGNGAGDEHGLALSQAQAQAASAFTAVALPPVPASPRGLHERFLEAALHVAELHFALPAAVAPASAPPGAAPQATWHSNLGMGIVCALHAEPGAKRDAAARLAVEHACAQGAAHVVIPLREWVLEQSALELESEALLRGDLQRTQLDPKAVAKLFRAVKAALVGVAHRNQAGKLATVTFLVKSSCPSLRAAADVLDAAERADASPMSPVHKVLQADVTIAAKAKALLEKIFDQ
jgi:hypothetical protein